MVAFFLALGILRVGLIAVIGAEWTDCILLNAMSSETARAGCTPATSVRPSISKRRGIRKMVVIVQMPHQVTYDVVETLLRPNIA